TRLDDAGRLDDILGLQRSNKRRSIDAKISQFLHGYFDEYPFVLSAQDLDFRDVRHPKELRARSLDVVTQLAMRKSVRGESVDDAERVAELVVEARPGDAGWQGAAHVADALADMVPGIGDLSGVSTTFQIDKNRGDAGGCDTS